MRIISDDAELCTLPLTFDFSANPFRCKTVSSQGPQYLIHALLAFSIQHVSRLGDGGCKESTDQQIAACRYSATDLCATTLLIGPNSTKNFVVDTILVLFALDVNLPRKMNFISIRILLPFYNYSTLGAYIGGRALAYAPRRCLS